MNIQEEFKDWISSLKEYLMNNETIYSKKIVYSSIKKHFAEFIQKLEFLELSNNFREIMYCILKDIPEIPICPVCKQNILPLRNYVIGFQQTCSKECAYKNFHSDKVHDKISKTVKAKYKNSLSQDSPIIKYNAERDTNDKNYFILKDYCKHGNVHIYAKTLQKINSINESTFCVECNTELYNTYIPTQKEIDEFKSSFEEFYNKHSLAFKKSWWILYYPKKLKILKIIFEQATNESFNIDNPLHLSEAYYIARNNLSSRPICCDETCNEKTHFSGSTNNYTKFCDKHGVGYNSSYKELELKKFIDSLNVKYIHTDREQISKELDFYFPEHKIAIEFNGCWYHCDKFKDKKYHANKFKECLDKNIQMITICEDDWSNKENIVKHLIKSKLNIFKYKIGARETTVRDVGIEESRTFLNEYHLQGYCNSRYRYGLYYNDDLVMLLTIGPSRFKKNELEILRICTKSDYCILGGASKLFKYFLGNHPEINSIVSYANCDISVGKIYEKLGFKYIGTTENWSWLYNGKRINRFNNIRKRKDELELYKCYSCGTMKFIYTKY